MDKIKEIEFLVIENGGTGFNGETVFIGKGPSVWRGTQEFIIERAKESHFFDYKEHDRDSFLKTYGDFEGFEEEEKIINDTGAVVMLSLNMQSPDEMESLPKSKSKGVFEYALDSIFSSKGGQCFPESELKNNLKNLSYEQVNAIEKFLK